MCGRVRLGTWMLVPLKGVAARCPWSGSVRFGACALVPLREIMTAPRKEMFLAVYFFGASLLPLLSAAARCLWPCGLMPLEGAVARYHVQLLLPNVNGSRAPARSWEARVAAGRCRCPQIFVAIWRLLLWRCFHKGVDSYKTQTCLQSV